MRSTKTELFSYALIIHFNCAEREAKVEVWNVAAFIAIAMAFSIVLYVRDRNGFSLC